MSFLARGKTPLLHSAKCPLQEMRLLRQVGGLVHADRDSGSPISYERVTPPQTLAGQVAWVVGGAGIIGRGICRGLLNAGATVIVNSGSQARLDQLLKEFDNSERLVGIFGSMRNPECAQALVKNSMDMTNGRLNHVVAHCGVRWWASSQLSAGTGDNNLWPCSPGSSSLNYLGPQEFVERASLLPVLHMAAAQQLFKHLQHNQAGASYTFVTGRAGDQGNIEAQVNAHAVWGLAAALRQQYASSPVRVAELRVNLQVDRPAGERDADPRHTPLSRDIGEICAGVAASASEMSRGLHRLSKMGDIDDLKTRFPCPEYTQ